MKLEELLRLKEEKDFVILAHYYVDGEIQAIADYVGDSFSLAKKATEVEADHIIMAGVYFMGETIKILNPDKHVYVPNVEAECPMAHMITVEEIEKMRQAHDDLAVVCYVNSTAEIKAHADYCCTSSNAKKVISAIKEKNIFFIPDGNLGANISEFFPEKNIICHSGHCPVHHKVTAEDVKELKKAHPQAAVLAHPECRPEVMDHVDYKGSTSGIIEEVGRLDHDEFIILTEEGILWELERRYPEKKFIFPDLICEGMKMVTLKDIQEIVEGKREELVLDAEVARRAKRALDNMLEACAR